jgi:hypothetical protein
MKRCETFVAAQLVAKGRERRQRTLSQAGELKKSRHDYCVAMREFQKYRKTDHILPNGDVINTSQVVDLKEAERLVTLHVNAVSELKTQCEELKKNSFSMKHCSNETEENMKLLDEELLSRHQKLKKTCTKHCRDIQRLHQTWATISQNIKEKEIAWDAWQKSKPSFVTSVEDILVDFQIRTKAYEYASKEQSKKQSLLIAREAENTGDLLPASALSVASVEVQVLKPTSKNNMSNSNDSLRAPARIAVDFTTENDGDSIVPAIDLDRTLRIDLTIPEESLVGFEAYAYTRTYHRYDIYIFVTMLTVTVHKLTEAFCDFCDFCDLILFYFEGRCTT